MKKTAKAHTLDSFDLKILEILQNDASKPTAEIADRVGLSQSPCWKRIDRLEREGYIEGRVAVLNRKLLGLEVMAFIHVKLSEPGRQKLGLFEASISRMPEVMGCYTILGEMDFLIHACVRDMDHLEAFLKEGLWSISGIQEIRTNIVLSRAKITHRLPLS